MGEISVIEARQALDAWVREVVEWHFSPETGCPYWLDRAKGLGFDPRAEVKCFADLLKFDREEAGHKEISTFIDNEAVVRAIRESREADIRASHRSLHLSQSL